MKLELTEEYVNQWLNTKSRLAMVSEVNSILTRDLYLNKRDDFQKFANIVLDYVLVTMFKSLPEYYMTAEVEDNFVKTSSEMYAKILYTCDFDLDGNNERISNYTYRLHVFDTDTARKYGGFRTKLLELVNTLALVYHFNENEASCLFKSCKLEELIPHIPRMVTLILNEPGINKDTVDKFLTKLVSELDSYPLNKDEVLNISYVLALKDAYLDGYTPDSELLTNVQNFCSSLIEQTTLNNLLHVNTLIGKPIDFNMWKTIITCAVNNDNSSSFEF